MDFIFDLLILALFSDVVMHLYFVPYLSFSFWIILKDPCFVTCNHVLQENSVTLDPFQKMKTQVLPIFRFWGTIFAFNFIMANSCVKI